MIQAKVIHDTRRETSKGYPVKIYISGDSQKKYLSTGIYCTVKEWEKPDRLLADRLKKLNYQVQITTDACNRENLTFNQAAGKFQPQSTLLTDVVDQFIDEYKAAGKSVRSFEEMKRQMEQYQPKASINEITYEWLTNFITHKRKSNTGNAGISYYLRSLRTVYLEAQRRESFSIRPGNPFRGVIPKTTVKKKIVPTRKDLEKFAQYQPKHGTTEKAKLSIGRKINVFLFQIHIGGQDFTDVARLKYSDIRNGRIRFYRHKMRNRGGELVDNILLPEALEILEKYSKGTGRLFPWIPVKEPRYSEYRNNTNRTLREISDSLKIPRVRTKSPRYIFRSWAGESGADIIATMQIQGHKAQGVTFGYQSRLPDRIVDEVLKKIVTLK